MLGIRLQTTGSLLLIGALSLASRSHAEVSSPLELPPPTGPFSVGTLTHHWVDLERDDDFLPDQEHLAAALTVWYPAESPPEKTEYAPYFPELEELLGAMDANPDRSGFASRLAPMARLTSHSVEGAPMSNQRELFPIVMLSPGGNVSRRSYTALSEELASHGYIVCAISHPYSGLDLIGGKAHVSHSRWSSIDGDDEEARRADDALCDHLATDARRALDRLIELASRTDNPLHHRLDPSKVAILGHSRGGSTVGRACTRDKRFRAAVVLDNIGPDQESETGLKPPQLTIRTDESRRWDSTSIERLRSYLSLNRSAGYEAVIRNAIHMSFTDIPFASPQASGRFLATARVLELTSLLVRTFLTQALDPVRGGDDGLAAIANRAPEVELWEAGRKESDSTLPDGSLIGIRDYTFPNYEDAWGYTRVDGSTDSLTKYWSKAEYDAATTDPGFLFEKLIYASDGLKVITYVVRPRTAESRSFPTLIFNRGSGVHKDLAPVLAPLMHRFARKGYVVFAPMIRESDGSEGDDANGGEDLNDLMNLLPLTRSLDYVDQNNLFMSGESRGAMMTFQALREGFPVRAAAVWGGFSDLGAIFEQAPAIVEYARTNWPGFDAEDPTADIRRRSVIYWPEAIKRPLLIMHGGRDTSVPPFHSLNLAQRLGELGRIYSLMIFAENGHVLAESQFERDSAILSWFERYRLETQARVLDQLRKNGTEREINRYGYQQLLRGNQELALAAFKMNVERFPESSNAHDSLGESLDSMGDANGALASYARALELARDRSDRTRIRNTMRKIQSKQK